MVRRLNAPWMATLVAVVTYSVVMSWYTTLKYLTFHTHAADLGIFAQAIASALFHHRFFYETIDIAIIPRPGPLGYSFFDVHFSPTLLITLPLYALYPSPLTLLVFQSVMVALGALPIYWFGRYLGREWLGVLLAVLYLMNPLVQGANSFDFHMETLFMPLTLYMLYFLFTRRWRLYYPFLILSLGTIEFAPLPLFLMGLSYTAMNHRRRDLIMHGFITMITSLAFLALALEVKHLLNPMGPTTASPLAGLPPQYSSSFDLSILAAIIKNPLLVVRLYSSYGTYKLLYFLELYSPFAFLPFLDPLILPSLAWPLVSFLTTNTIYFSPYFQYSSFSIPFIVFATLMATSRLPGSVIKRVSALLFISTLVVFLGVSPLIHFTYTFTKSDEEVWNALRLIPMNETVLVQNNLFPIFSNNVNAYTQWYPGLKPMYIVAQPSSFWFTWYGTPYNEYVNLALGEGYGIYMELGNDLLVLKLNYTGKPVLCRPITLVLGPDNVTLINGVLINNSIAHTYTEPPGEWFTATVYLPPGNYTVTINYTWSGPTYLRGTGTALALLNINGKSLPLPTGADEASLMISMPVYGELTITAYANYVINTTVYLHSITISGPLC
ncbi:DUF2079 domain-containing protein [Vulcanisaeta thermophila]|uniref:DUF2079 domain-containing protein n=1 Tax=Vulcanisaeta thermophila TaxID=867917 RepID=UPI0008537C3B|nr:DUF2079 domain-containing protein [Vulcanisaeta thermophila]